MCHSRPYNRTQGQISPQKWFYSCCVDVEVAAVVGAGYYFKVVKSNDDGFGDFEDDEIPNDDFFRSSDKEDNEEEDNETEYTKEDLM